MTNECVEFAPIGGSCPKPDPEENASLDNLLGEWWQHWGHNPLWDCYPCQHIHEMKLIDDKEFCAQTVGPDGPVQSPCYSYTYSYDLYLKDNKTKYF